MPNPADPAPRPPTPHRNTPPPSPPPPPPPPTPARAVPSQTVRAHGDQSQKVCKVRKRRGALTRECARAPPRTCAAPVDNN